MKLALALPLCAYIGESCADVSICVGIGENCADVSVCVGVIVGALHSKIEKHSGEVEHDESNKDDRHEGEIQRHSDEVRNGVIEEVKGDNEIDEDGMFELKTSMA